MKTSMACTGMLSSEISNSKKKWEKRKKYVHYMHGSSNARGTVFLSPTQFVVEQKHERKHSHKAVLYISQNNKI